MFSLFVLRRGLLNECEIDRDFGTVLNGRSTSFHDDIVGADFFWGPKNAMASLLVGFDAKNDAFADLQLEIDAAVTATVLMATPSFIFRGR